MEHVMAKLTKAEAARQLGIARSTLYKLINQGAISATADGMIDSTELVRAAAFVDNFKERSRTPAYTQGMDTQQRAGGHDRHVADTDRGRPHTPVHEQQNTSEADRSRTYADLLVDTLREQLQATRETIQREREVVQERERAYREHIERLTLMLHEAQQRSDRLLEAPRSPPAPAAPPPTPATSAPRGETPRGDMRRRIVALLREHPDGLAPVQIRHRLGVDKNLGHTMHAMARDGLVRRVATGRYVAREP
jgi:excisionase family DNA binding protein